MATIRSKYSSREFVILFFILGFDDYVLSETTNILPAAMLR